MKESKMTLDEVFSFLNSRLFQLNNYKEIIYQDKYSHRQSHSLFEIEKYIFNYPADLGSDKVDFALNQIKDLEALGIKILDNVELYSHYDYDDHKRISLPKRAAEKFKQEIFENIQEELAFYKLKLKPLSDQLRKMAQPPASEYSQSASHQKTLHDKTNLPHRLNSADVSLDKYQTALLFNYLREEKIIQDYSNSSLAKIVALLTGHSEQNLRTDHGFGAIEFIKSDKKKNNDKSTGEYYNLNSLKAALQKIIEKIDFEIELKKKSQSKK